MSFVLDSKYQIKEIKNNSCELDLFKINMIQVYQEATFYEFKEDVVEN